jgi:hypothetical protein
MMIWSYSAHGGRLGLDDRRFEQSRVSLTTEQQKDYGRLGRLGRLPLNYAIDFTSYDHRGPNSSFCGVQVTALENGSCSVVMTRGEAESTCKMLSFL